MIRTSNTSATPAAGVAASRLTFGGRNTAASADNSVRPESDVWMNIGYETGDPKYPMVSLPFGIPVDTQQPLKITGRDADFIAFTGARNQLLQEIQDLAATLKPGEEATIGGTEGGLVIQLRRRNGEAEAPVAGENRFARSLFVTEAAE